MVEYIEREKLADGLKEWQNRLIETYGDNDEYVRCLNSVLFNVDNAPAADVRPVVLCKDCRHRDPEDHKCDCGQLERAGCVFPVDDNYWCAHGEKREES